ncbi:MAG: macro domain-containing protein [Planctomycetota bacterium]|jgi:O-acetyl-ADP-ribose deacetylase (regulator of RNase III)
MQVTINHTVLELTEGDITEASTEAIVNPANEALVLGGGVAGAIRTKGGPAIQAECSKISPTCVGAAVKTTAGNLKANYVIHAVGPRMGEGDEDAKLKSATLNALILADRDRIKSVTFPAISTGIFGFPMDRCAEIMLQTTIDYLNGETDLEKIVFCLYGLGGYKIFANQLTIISNRNP